MDITFEVGDAEALPYPDDSFGIVLSTLGVMFAPDQQRAANELIRVCRPGGRIGLANWTPEGFAGQLLKTVGGYAPPPPGLDPPVLWGTEERLTELFGSRVDLEIEPDQFIFRDVSAENYIKTHCSYFGLIISAMNRIDEDVQPQLVSDMTELVSSFSSPTGDSIEIPSSYLQVIGTVR